MAELQHTGDGGRKRGARKQSARIDMIPLVGLAFLLLTFVMLTSSFAKPKVMQISLPVTACYFEPDLPRYCGSTLTVILGPNDKVFFYDGLVRIGEPEPELLTTDYSENGIRKHLRDRNASPHLFVTIKALKEARYKNMVDILDEMSITNISAYALVKDFTSDEKRFIKEKTGIDVGPALVAADVRPTTAQ